MQDKEQWKELCNQASVEQDPKKLMALVTEITRLLEEKQKRLNSMRLKNDTSTNQRGIEPSD
jgi:hypothetical protein